MEDQASLSTSTPKAAQSDPYLKNLHCEQCLCNSQPQPTPTRYNTSLINSLPTSFKNQTKLNKFDQLKEKFKNQLLVKCRQRIEHVAYYYLNNTRKLNTNHTAKLTKLLAIIQQIQNLQAPYLNFEQNLTSQYINAIHQLLKPSQKSHHKSYYQFPQLITYFEPRSFLFVELVSSYRLLTVRNKYFTFTNSLTCRFEIALNV
eukprot:TRINITY_DN3871_c0_g1_i3.p1 TRINITY_DN3871_c0_g1~~TRINITY_DN3871_c0_g1_i3.p1  ORF type:complete len:211 (+),score=-24.16 TRINITY_DN3871_c0_g1_i3:29-634(+)